MSGPLHQALKIQSWLFFWQQERKKSWKHGVLLPAVSGQFLQSMSASGPDTAEQSEHEAAVICLPPNSFLSIPIPKALSLHESQRKPCEELPECSHQKLVRHQKVTPCYYHIWIALCLFPGCRLQNKFSTDLHSGQGNPKMLLSLVCRTGMQKGPKDCTQGINSSIPSGLNAKRAHPVRWKPLDQVLEPHQPIPKMLRFPAQAKATIMLK